MKKGCWLETRFKTCCCTCVNQIPLVNSDTGKKSGFVCILPSLMKENFYHSGSFAHGMCECHERRPTPRALDAAAPSYTCGCGFIVAVGETECVRCKTPRK